MGLWFRLIYFVFAVRLRARIGVLDVCETSFRCWPLDLDTLGHMNNSRYLAVMDLGRLDLLVRTGMWRVLRRRGRSYVSVMPILEAQTIRYRKSIQPWQTFKIVTKVVGWDEKSFFITQTFMRKGDVVAEAIVKGRFLKRTRGTVPPADIMEMAGGPRESPKVDSAIEVWNASISGVKAS